MSFGFDTVTVIICTRNRATLLKRTLESLECQNVRGSELTVAVVNNASEDDTENVLSNNWRFALLRLYESVPGKALALNRALATLDGSEFVAFTDDDVVVSENWLSSLLRAARSYPSAPLFCGPIVPEFPAETHEWLKQHSMAGALFALFTPRVPEGILPPPALPFGPNFAVQGGALKGMRFRTDLGPSQEHGPIFGEDTEFVQRFRKRGEPIIYVPAAGVRHWISPERVTSSSIVERMFYLGRSWIILYSKTNTLLPDELQILAKISSGAPDARQLNQAMIFNFCCGEICQLQLLNETERERGLREALVRSGLSSSLDLLGPSALNAVAGPLVGEEGGVALRNPN